MVITQDINKNEYTKHLFLQRSECPYSLSQTFHGLSCYKSSYLAGENKKKSPKKKKDEASNTYLALVRLILNIFWRDGRMVNPLQQLCWYLCTKHR